MVIMVMKVPHAIMDTHLLICCNISLNIMLFRNVRIIHNIFIQHVTNGCSFVCSIQLGLMGEEEVFKLVFNQSMLYISENCVFFFIISFFYISSARLIFFIVHYVCIVDVLCVEHVNVFTSLSRQAHVVYSAI